MYIKDLNKLSYEDLKGKIICFPTDTVYGVGCLIDDEEALEKIYNLKHRDLSKPLAVLVPNKESIYKLIKNSNNLVDEWIDKYWPGALTIIFNKAIHVSDNLTRGLSTIGLRMPNSKIALEVLNKFGPLATTSVNLSNTPALNDLELIKLHFGDQIDYIIEDKEVSSKVSSTVVDATKDEPVILRQGDIKLFN